MKIETINALQEYWSRRAGEQGSKTVAFGGISTEEFYKTTQEWVIKFSPYWTKYLFGKKLDFGCGVGRFTRYLGNAIGVDVTEVLVNIANNSSGGCEYIYSQNPERLPFKNCTFDSIWTCTVLQHLVVPGLIEKTIKEFYRTLEKGGVVLFYENTAYSDKLMGHIYFRGITKYIELFNDAGFKCREIMSFTEDAGTDKEKHTLFLAEKTQ